MAYEKSDVDITPKMLEEKLTESPIDNYYLNKMSSQERQEKLKELCKIMKAFSISTGRSSEIYLFDRDQPEHLVPLINLSSRIYELARKQKTTFGYIITGIAAKADTYFDFKPEFPDSGRLINAVILHGAKSGGNGKNMVAKGIAAVEDIIESDTERDVSEEVFSHLRHAPPEHDMKRYAKLK
jgi:hypothetical protein